MIKTSYGKNMDCNKAMQQCINGLQQAHPTLLILFLGGQHNPAQALSILQHRYPRIPIVGGAVAGAISREGFGYTGFEIGIIAIEKYTPYIFTEEGMDEHIVGKKLGTSIKNASNDDAVVLLFFDSVANSDPLRLHAGSSLIQGFNTSLGDRKLHVVGAGMLTDLDISNAWVFDGSTTKKHTAVALLFPPAIKAHTVILHGCKPVGGFLEITKIDGAEVLEIDDEPALNVIERMIGLPEGSAKDADLLLIATLGERQGNRFASYDENAYVNRLILSANQEKGSVTLFEPDFQEGTQVQIMHRDNALMIESVVRGVQGVNTMVQSKQCVLNLYIDCAGRTCARSGATSEEADIVLHNIAPHIPFMGFYSGVEIAPFGINPSKSLDWTGVLTTLFIK